MLENLIVGVIVITALTSVVWKWIPKRFRTAAGGKITQTLVLAGLTSLARSLEKKSSVTGGCAGCSNCKAGEVPSNEKYNIEVIRKS